MPVPSAPQHVHEPTLRAVLCRSCSPALPQALIVVYAFRLPHLLNPQIGRCAHRGLYRRHILHIVLRGPALCFLAAGFSLFFYPLVSGGGAGGRRRGG